MHTIYTISTKDISKDTEEKIIKLLDDEKIKFKKKEKIKKVDKAYTAFGNIYQALLDGKIKPILNVSNTDSSLSANPITDVFFEIDVQKRYKIINLYITFNKNRSDNNYNLDITKIADIFTDKVNYKLNKYVGPILLLLLLGPTPDKSILDKLKNNKIKVNLFNEEKLFNNKESILKQLFEYDNIKELVIYQYHTLIRLYLGDSNCFKNTNMFNYNIIKNNLAYQY